MMNVALGQEEVYSCAFWLLTMVSLRNPWAGASKRDSLGCGLIGLNQPIDML